MNQSQSTSTLFSGQVRNGLLRGIEDRGDHVVFHSVKLGNKLQCKQAQTARELAEAQRFWLSRYREAGLMEQVSDNITASSFSVPPSLRKLNDPVFAIGSWRPVLFTAHRNGIKKSHVRSKTAPSPRRPVVENTTVTRLCGTLTLMVPDSRNQTDLRNSPQIGRLTRFAIGHEDLGPRSVGSSYQSVFMELASFMHRTAIAMGIVYLDAIVHPRHAKLYRRIFGAAPIGQPFECEEVGGSPGQYMRANIAHPDRFHSRIRTQFAAGVDAA